MNQLMHNKVQLTYSVLQVHVRKLILVNLGLVGSVLTIRYMICCFNMCSKADTSQLIYHKEPKTEKNKTDMLRSIGKQSGKSVESVL